MKLMDYAYPLADEPTLRMPAIEPTFDEAEHYIIVQLEALFGIYGTMPGTIKTWAEARAEVAAELLNDLQALRRVRNDSANKVYPKKRRWKR